MSKSTNIHDDAARIGSLLEYIEQMAEIGECRVQDAGALLGGIQSVSREAMRLAEGIELAANGSGSATGHFIGLDNGATP
jgi:hypothetical protein